MDLRKLHSKLYRKNDDIEERALSKDRFDPEDQSSSDSFVKSDGLDFKDTIELDQRNFSKRNKMIGTVLISIATFIVLIVIAFFIVKYIQGAYSEERVFLKIEGVESVDSGDVLEYKISVFNNNRSVLNNVSLDLMYSSEIEPKDFDNWEENGLNRKKIIIGTIGSQETKEYTIPFAVFGAKDVRVYLDVSMEYQPENINSSFKKNVQGSSIINSSPLQVEIFSTKDVANGERMKINLVVNNKSEELFENVELSINYPEQFNYQESTIAPTEENNKWVIGSIIPAGQTSIIISGTLNGDIDSSALFSVIIGRYDQVDKKLVKYSESSDVSNIISNRMEVTQVVRVSGKDYLEGDSIRSGQVVSYDIRFKNTSEDLLRDLILKEKVLSRVIDEDSINAKGGYYDNEKREIIWKVSSVPALKLLDPDEEGTVSFSVQLKNEFPVDSENDRNFTLETQSSIESLDVNSPISENKEIYSEKLVLKVDSRFIYSLTGSYDDTELPNEGPIPIELNQKTTFTPRLSVRNTSNDMEDVVFTASFPSGITWEGDYSPTDADIQFNERTNELVWNIGIVKAGTGFFLPIENIAFRIGITPSEAQLQRGGSALLLIDNLNIKAKDSFTGKIIEESFADFKLYNISDY